MPLSLLASHAAPASVDTALLVVILATDPVLTPALVSLDASVSGALSRTLTRRDFRGAKDETLLLVGQDAGGSTLVHVGALLTMTVVFYGLAWRRLSRPT